MYPSAVTVGYWDTVGERQGCHYYLTPQTTCAHLMQRIGNSHDEPKNCKFMDLWIDLQI